MCHLITHPDFVSYHKAVSRQKQFLKCNRIMFQLNWIGKKNGSYFESWNSFSMPRMGNEKAIRGSPIYLFLPLFLKFIVNQFSNYCVSRSVSVLSLKFIASIAKVSLFDGTRNKKITKFKKNKSFREVCFFAFDNIMITYYAYHTKIFSCVWK